MMRITSMCLMCLVFALLDIVDWSFSASAVKCSAAWHCTACNYHPLPDVLPEVLSVVATADLVPI